MRCVSKRSDVACEPSVELAVRFAALGQTGWICCTIGVRSGSVGGVSQTESVMGFILAALWSENESRWIAPKNLSFFLPFRGEKMIHETIAFMRIFFGVFRIFEKIPNYFGIFLKKSPRPDIFFFDQKSKN